MRRCIIASLFVVILLISASPTVALAEESGKPGSPFGPFQEPYVPIGEDAEHGELTPYGHELTPLDKGEWEDPAARPYYIGRVEDFYPE